MRRPNSFRWRSRSTACARLTLPTATPMGRSRDVPSGDATSQTAVSRRRTTGRTAAVEADPRPRPGARTRSGRPAGARRGRSRGCGSTGRGCPRRSPPSEPPARRPRRPRSNDRSRERRNASCTSLTSPGCASANSRRAAQTANTIGRPLHSRQSAPRSWTRRPSRGASCRLARSAASPMSTAAGASRIISPRSGGQLKYSGRTPTPLRSTQLGAARRSSGWSSRARPAARPARPAAAGSTRSRRTSPGRRSRPRCRAAATQVVGVAQVLDQADRPDVQVARRPVLR